MNDMADKIDLTRLHKLEYKAAHKPFLVDIGEARYLAVAGRGEPGGDEFAAKVGALYGMAYTVKMTRKAAGRRDYVVCKLECQWWADGGASIDGVPPAEWNWRLMIRTPEFVGADERDSAVAALLSKGKDPEVNEVELIDFVEGPCVQMLHVGPYEKEPETVVKMAAYAETEDLAPHGRHHEIYLSDPRRVAPEKLKTILRIPVKTAG
jgi:hypothetical protein